MVCASVIDGQVDAAECRKRKALLQERFPLVDEATAREHDSVDLYRFTSVARELDQTAASASSRCCGKW